MVVFDVLAEPHRRRILDLLRDGSRSVGELVNGLMLSQPAVSKHLRVLRDAGLVEAEVSAQRRLYRVRPEPLREIDEWLTPFRAMWGARLDDLERHLDTMPDDPEPKGTGARWGPNL
jgi:DNA-binding transcriptional ArsR family regulator